MTNRTSDNKNADLKAGHLDIDQENQKKFNNLCLRVTTLTTILGGLQLALSELELCDEEKRVTSCILQRYGEELDKIKKIIDRISNPSSLKPTAKVKKKQVNPGPLSDLDNRYKRQKEKQIEDTHEVSGYHRQRVVIVRGGAPGSGKKT